MIHHTRREVWEPFSLEVICWFGFLTANKPESHLVRVRRAPLAGSHTRKMQKGIESLLQKQLEHKIYSCAWYGGSVVSSYPVFDRQKVIEWAMEHYPGLLTDGDLDYQLFSSYACGSAKHENN